MFVCRFVYMIWCGCVREFSDPVKPTVTLYGSVGQWMLAQCRDHPIQPTKTHHTNKHACTRPFTPLTRTSIQLTTHQNRHYDVVPATKSAPGNQTHPLIHPPTHPHIKPIKTHTPLYTHTHTHTYIYMSYNIYLSHLSKIRHYDVVPATERAWKSDPFGMVALNGYLYGRGVTDNKGGCVFVLFYIMYYIIVIIVIILLYIIV